MDICPSVDIINNKSNYLFIIIQLYTNFFFLTNLTVDNIYAHYVRYN